MRKANDRIINILKIHRAGIELGLRQWLEDKETCPFRYIGIGGEEWIGCEICDYFFPRKGANCPCDSYSVEYTVRVAKYLLNLLKKGGKNESDRLLLAW